MAHLVMDISHVPLDVDLDHAFVIERVLLDVAKKTNAKVVGHVSHQFVPVGATAILLLSESHMSAHSYPEYRQIHIDYYHCGKDSDTRLQHAVELFTEFYGNRAEKRIFYR
jgi:S-adenosylmethionine decarboxylase